MVKVKAHSGDWLNDKADQIAKAAAVIAPRINLQYMSIPGLKLVLTCDHLTVDFSSRQSIKQLFEAKAFHELLQLQRNKDIATLTENHHIHWPSTTFMLNYNNSETNRGSTSFL